MSFTEGPDEYECHDCGCAITLDQYRRKVARCDDCEARALVNGSRWLDADHWLASLTDSDVWR